MGCYCAQAYQLCPAAGRSYEEVLCFDAFLQYLEVQQTAVNDHE